MGSQRSFGPADTVKGDFAEHGKSRLLVLVSRQATAHMSRLHGHHGPVCVLYWPASTGARSPRSGASGAWNHPYARKTAAFPMTMSYHLQRHTFRESRGSTVPFRWYDGNIAN